MDPAVIGRTLETLGKVIRKPPLTEKLLGKPPFRYLHDILTEVIRTTGFFKGLYTDSELKSDNVKEKDAKINFLQKAVDVIALVTGEPLTVKPARIVAGHEPEKTNELLQAIGKCCLEKLSSNEAVRRVLAGEKPDSRVKSNSKPQDKVSIDAKDKDRKRNKQDKRESDNREGSGSRERREKHFEEERKNVEKERERKKESEKDRVGEEQRNGLKEGEKMNKEKNKARDSRLDTEINKIKEKTRDRKSDGSRRKEKDRIKENGSERDHGKERSKEMDPERHKRKERAREDEQREREEIKIKEQEKTMRKSKGSDNSPKRALEDPMKENKSAADKERLSNAVKAERPSASKLRERRPARFDMEGESDSEEEKESSEPPATDFKENLDVQSPNMTQSRRIPRPGSARPAPPRVRRQGSAEVPVPERVGSGKEVANVIVDKEKEDDDEFVVEEAPLQLPDMPEMELGQRVELREDEKHGALVNKILETKKDYDTQADTENKEKVFLSDAGKKQEKDLVIREIEKLHSSIQTLCRSALPLGKIMDYLQEDVDTMQNELQIWRRENNRHAKALLQEQSVTETAVEPLKAELAELEQLIKEQQDKICSTKANILRNEVKIQKMVLRINV